MGQCQSLPQGPLRRGQIRGSEVKANPVEVKTVRRHVFAGQETKSDLEAEMPQEHRWSPVEHFVVTNGVWRRIPVEQKYRPAEHGSKPIPVYDARDYGDDLDEILPRTPLSDAVIGPRRRYPW